jgi:hypothetical protein
LRLADFSGQPVDDDRHAVARIIDEKPFAGRMGLPHRGYASAPPKPLLVDITYVPTAEGVQCFIIDWPSPSPLKPVISL